MKIWLHDNLRCPDCLPDEVPLTLDSDDRDTDEIIDGRLVCPECRQEYPIEDGVAIVLPRRSRPLLSNVGGYNSWGMLSAYLWSHYGEFFNDPDATDAYRRWSASFIISRGYALDIGCAVGRLSFELSKTHARVIGVDTSLSFITQARALLRQRRLVFDLITEGLIAERRVCDLDPAWNYAGVDFIVADALALPFPRGFFATVASVNILEKVSHPRRHLVDVDRVLRQENAMFVFADPFSWDQSVSPPELWLGGTVNGRNPGRGFDNMTAFFQGGGGLFSPPFKIVDQGAVLWKIRKTENLREHINSQYLVGIRNNAEFKS